MGVKPENYFKLKDGRVIKNLYELSNALKKMPEDVFKYHVNSSKNDFSIWVRDVIKEKDLAKSVANLKSAKGMNKVITKKLLMTKNANGKKQVKRKPKSKKENIMIMPDVAMQEMPKKDIIAKIREFMYVDDKKEELPIKKTTIKLGTGCPYKSFQCSIVELLAGAIIGVIIGLFLSSII